MSKSIAFIGVGNMGCPMAENLMKAGKSVKVFDVSKKMLEIAKDKNLETTENLDYLITADVETVITMLPEGKHSKEVYLGENGIINKISKNCLLIDCSTIDIQTSIEIGKKALEFLSTKFGKRLFGITTDKEIIPRAKVYLSSNEQKIGYLSASTWSPTLEKYVGYVRFDYPGEWKEFQIKVESVNDNLADCEIIDLPFYDKEKLIPKGIDKNIP